MNFITFIYKGKKYTFGVKPEESGAEIDIDEYEKIEEKCDKYEKFITYMYKHIQNTCNVGYQIVNTDGNMIKMELDKALS